MADLEGSAGFIDMRLAGHVELNDPMYTPLPQLGIGGLSKRMLSARLEEAVGDSTLDTPDGIREHAYDATVYNPNSESLAAKINLAVLVGVCATAWSVAYFLSAR